MEDSTKQNENNYELDQPKIDFLLEVEYLMQQMGNRHVSLKEGYRELMLKLGQHDLKNLSI